jgi:hypothetical protein
MPVRRYRDVRDVPPPPAVDPADPMLLERIFALWSFASSAAGPLHAPGVQRFASIEEADAAREAALHARMRRTRPPP